MLEWREGRRLMAASAGRCQEENVKITFKLSQWRRGKTTLREPEELATSLVFLLATLSLKKLRALLVSLLRQTLIHLRSIYSSLATSDPVLDAWDTDLRPVSPVPELIFYGTPVEVHQVTFSRNYFKW